MINRMERKIKIRDLNQYISCLICGGYLIDATTVTECLHTFCKSCLIKHLEGHNTCPKCKNVIHQSHPVNYISYDRTMQDIVYKLVPNLHQTETRREREFYRNKGLPYPKANAVQQHNSSSNNVNSSNNNNQHNSDKDVIKSFTFNNNNNSITSNNNNNNNIIMNTNNNSVNHNLTGSLMNGFSVDSKNHVIMRDDRSDCHRSDEQVNILIESIPGSNLKSVKRKFIRCSSHTTVTHIKKFVAKKLFNNYDRYKEIDILCDDHLLGKDHTLKFIYVTYWRFRDPPLKLTYRPRVEF